MTETDVRNKMQEGYNKVSPIVANVTNLIMDAYQEGFKNCWELLTGQKFNPEA